MTKTEARHQARHESRLYRQRPGWIATTWCDDLGGRMVDGPATTYSHARQQLADWRRRRAALLYWGDIQGEMDAAREREDWDRHQRLWKIWVAGQLRADDTTAAAADAVHAAIESLGRA